MNKTLKLMAVLAALAAFSFTSCKEQEPEEQPKEQPTITVAPTSLSFDTAAASKDLTIKSNTDWTVTSDASWLTVTPLKGSKDGSVSVAAAANVGEAGAAAAAREAVITVAIEGKKVDIKVSQSAETIVFVVSGDTAEIPAAGGQVAVKVEYNEAYTTDALPEWISAATKATKTDNLVYYVAANDKAEAREGKISFKSTSGKTGSVTVKQAAKEQEKPLEEIASADDFNKFAATAKSYTAGTTVKLVADITLAAGQFTPIDTLLCIFDGQNHTVTYEIATEQAATENALYTNVGLIRYAAGNVKNLKVAGKITHSAAEGSGTYHIGGIVGYLDGTGVIDNCSSSVEITATTKCTHHIGGICGYVAAGATISNCVNNGPVSMKVNGNSNASQLGGIVGHIEGSATVTKCTNKAAVLYEGIGTPRSGGICGYINNLVEVKFEECSNEGAITLNEGLYTASSWSYVGGLTGYYGTPNGGSKASYIKCSNSGTISLNVTDAVTRVRVGQIASHGGRASFDENMNWTFDGCKASGTIESTIPTAKYFIAGGILGYAEKNCIVDFKDCEFSGNITGIKGYYGGIVGGTCSTSSTFTNINITKDAVLKANDKADKMGALGGNNSAYTTAITGKVGAAKLINGENTLELTSANYQASLFANSLGEGGSTEGVTFDGPGESGGEEGTTMTISSVDDFLALVANTDAQADANLVVELGADLDFTGKEAAELQIPAFAGTFDGKGHSIKNFTTVGVGLFKALSGTLKNLVIDSSCQLQMNGDANSAVLVMTNTGIIDGITVNADVTGTITTAKTTRHTGCICSINRNIIKNCVNNGNATFTAATATAQYRYAPIVGSNSNTTGFDGPSVINCVNNGNITFTQTEGVNGGDKYFAGIAAVCDSKPATLIENCVNYGKITFKSTNPASPKLYPGGLVGLFKGGMIKNCKNFGDVENDATEPNSAAGGLIGCLKNDTSKLGADVNESLVGCVVNCKVISSSTAAGIILGSMTTAADKFVFGTEAEPIKVAGQVGEAVINAENYKTVLLGSAFELNDDRKVNAVFEAVAK